MNNFKHCSFIFFATVIFTGCYQSTSKDSSSIKSASHISHKEVAAKGFNVENEGACLLPIAPGDTFKYISKVLEVKGDVENTLNLTVDSLKRMKLVTLNNLNVVCLSGATSSAKATRKAVLLKDILEKAVIVQQNHKDRNFIIVARATDNYKATFSWAEIFNNPTGDNTFVIFEEDGKPIASHGEMKLICANDIKTGPRQVIWLKSIEITRVN